MKYHLLKKIFSSGLQAVAVQVLGMLFFLVISSYLTVDDFGLISWGNGLCMMLATLLSFGMEQVVVRRIAASKTSEWAAAAYLFHAFIGSVLAFGVLISLSYILKQDSVRYHYLPWLFAAQATIYLGAPLKQFLNAKQKFTPYGIIALISNTLKVILAFVFIWQKTMTIDTVIFILILCGMIELGGLLYYVLRKTGFSFNFRFTAYTKLIKESMPQYLAVIFDSSLSRMDWILLGYLSTNAATAQYSFANRAFELSRLPIVIIAPIILNSFARTMSGGNKLTADKESEIKRLFVLESFAAMMLPLVLNLMWSPIVDYVFKGKYGSVNSTEFMLLSLCLPLQFFTNLLWTVSFAGKKYKTISGITISSAIINLVLNVILIHFYGSIGAALAYLFTSFFQTIAYYLVVRKNINFPIHTFFVFVILGAASFYVATVTTDVMPLRVVIAVAVYTALSFMLKQVQKSHFQTLKLYFRK